MNAEEAMAEALAAIGYGDTSEDYIPADWLLSYLPEGWALTYTPTATEPNTESDGEGNS